MWDVVYFVKDTKTNEKLYKSGDYLSTNDKSFSGAVGNQIKEIFKDKCKYEYWWACKLSKLLERIQLCLVVAKSVVRNANNKNTLLANTGYFWLSIIFLF